MLDQSAFAVRRGGDVDGEAILWIHGYTMDAGIWTRLWERLPRWRHVAIDLPGHGASPPLPPGVDLPALGDAIARLARAEGAHHLVGLSFGGTVGLQVAIQDPEAVCTLVLGSASLGGGPEDPHTRTRSRELARLYEERGPGPWMTDLWMRSPPDIFRGAASQPALWIELRAIVERHSWGELADQRMRGLAGHPQAERDLRRVRARTLVVVGEDDMEAIKRCGELIRRSIPGARRVYAPCGHLSLLEWPDAANAVAEHVRAAGPQRAEISRD